MGEEDRQPEEGTMTPTDQAAQRLEVYASKIATERAHTNALFHAYGLQNEDHQYDDAVKELAADLKLLLSERRKPDPGTLWRYV